MQYFMKRFTQYGLFYMTIPALYCILLGKCAWYSRHAIMEHSVKEALHDAQLGNGGSTRSNAHIKQYF
jgi:hypothetical protein